MRLIYFDKIRIISLIFFTMFIFLCYHSTSSNAQWDTYPYTGIFQEQWDVTTITLPKFQSSISYPKVPGSFDALWGNWGIKKPESYDTFLSQGLGLSCFFLHSGTGVPYCPGVSIKIKVY